MATHYEINPDPASLPLSLSQEALRLARGLQTANAGSVWIPNGDGTGTLIGEGAGYDSNGNPNGMLQWVGDKVEPGRPLGVSAACKSGIITISWGGRLEGGIPADFDHVEALAHRSGDPEVQVGVLTGAGAVGSGLLPEGSYDVWCVAVDVPGNRSKDSDHVTVVVDDPVAVIRGQAEQASKKADAAVEGMEQVRKDAENGVKEARKAAASAESKAQSAIDGMQSVRDDAAKGVQEAKTAANTAQSTAASAASKADKLANDLDGTKAMVEQHTTKLGEVETKVSNSVEHADQALSASTQAVQTANSVKTTADRAYDDAQSALTQSSTAVQTAGEVKTTLETNYLSKKDSDAAYASKSELKQTSDRITSTVEKTYATKSALEALRNIADNAVETWTGSQKPTASNAPASTWATDALRKQHAGDVYYDLTSGYSYRWGSADGKTYAWSLIKDSDITKAIADAAKAQSTANGAQKGVDKLNTDIPVTYATKSQLTQTAESITAKVTEAQRVGQNALDKASTVEQTASGLKTTVSEQASTIKGHTTTIGQLTQKADSLTSSLTQTNRKIDGMDIGGTNLLRDTKAFYNNNVADTETGYLRGYSTTVGDTYRGFVSRRITSSSNGVVGEWQVNDCAFGDEYVFSFWAKGSGKLCAFFYGPPNYIRCEEGSSSTGENPHGGDGSTELTLSSTWKRYWIRWKLETSGTTNPTKYLLLRNDNKADWQACGCKLEKGNKATDWSPSPLDSQATADTAITRASTLEQSLNGFKTSVSQTYETKSDSLAKKTALEQSLNSFKSTVSSTYSTKNELNGLSAMASKTWTFSKDGGSHPRRDWVRLGTLTSAGDAANVQIDVLTGDGWNGNARQNSRLSIVVKDAWQSSASTSNAFGVSVLRENCQSAQVMVMALAADRCEIWCHLPWQYGSGQYTLSGSYKTWSNNTLSQSGAPTSGTSQEVAYRLNAEQLQSDVAATYATKTSVEQTATSIKSSVSETYATKTTVQNLSTTLTQTKDSLTLSINNAQSTANTAKNNAADAQNRVGSLETCIKMTSSGVRVGRIKNGSFTGYSALVNSAGSFDVLDSAGKTLARFSSTGLTASGDLNITGKKLLLAGVPLYRDSSLDWKATSGWWSASLTHLGGVLYRLRFVGTINGGIVEQKWATMINDLPYDFTYSNAAGIMHVAGAIVGTCSMQVENKVMQFSCPTYTASVSIDVSSMVVRRI